MASWAAASRAAGAAARHAYASLSKGSAPASLGGARRGFAAGGGKGVTYEGLTMHEAAPWQKFFGEGLTGLMWFWVLYRMRHDYDTFIFGHAQHFEHEIAHEKEHGGHH